MTTPVSRSPSDLPKGLTYCSEWTSAPVDQELWERATTSVQNGEYSSIHPGTNFWDLPKSVAADIVRRIVAMAPHLLNRGNKNGETPLFTAVYMGRPDLIQLLIELGANMNIATNRSEHGLASSVLWSAIIVSSWQCAEVLFDHGAILYPTISCLRTQTLWNRSLQRRALQLKALELSPALSQAPIDVLKLVCRFAGHPASRDL